MDSLLVVGFNVGHHSSLAQYQPLCTCQRCQDHGTLNLILVAGRWNIEKMMVGSACSFTSSLHEQDERLTAILPKRIVGNESKLGFLNASQNQSEQIQSFALVRPFSACHYVSCSATFDITPSANTEYSQSRDASFTITCLHSSSCTHFLRLVHQYTLLIPK